MKATRIMIDRLTVSNSKSTLKWAKSWLKVSVITPLLWVPRKASTLSRCETSFKVNWFNYLCLYSYFSWIYWICIIDISMSANRLKNPKQKFDDFIKKDLTPKASQPSPKVSSIYSSFRGGLTMKPDLTPKSKIVRPSTSKNSNFN